MYIKDTFLAYFNFANIEKPWYRKRTFYNREQIVNMIHEIDVLRSGPKGYHLYI